MSTQTYLSSSHRAEESIPKTTLLCITCIVISINLSITSKNITIFYEVYVAAKWQMIISLCRESYWHWEERLSVRDRDDEEGVKLSQPSLWWPCWGVSPSRSRYIYSQNLCNMEIFKIGLIAKHRNNVTKWYVICIPIAYVSLSKVTRGSTSLPPLKTHARRTAG